MSIWRHLLKENETVAEAFATVLQNKQQVQFGGLKGKVMAEVESTFTSRDLESTFDAKAKETRHQAVQFLKGVTPCASCGARGAFSFTSGLVGTTQGDSTCKPC